MKYSLKLGKAKTSQIACGSKILPKLLYLARFSRYKHFCVLGFFAKNSKIQNGCHFLAGQKYFESWVTYSGELPCRWKISLKSLYLAQFSRYKHFLKKIRKFKMAAIFWQVKYSLKLGKATLHWYPVGQNFLLKSLYLPQFSRYKHFRFAIFAKNLKIQNSCHFLASETFVETWKC